MTNAAVCEPSAAGTIKSATAAADPLEELLASDCDRVGCVSYPPSNMQTRW